MTTDCFGKEHKQLRECENCLVYHSCKKEYMKKTRQCKSWDCENRFISSYGNERYCDKCREEAKMTRIKEKKLKPVNDVELSYYMALTQQRDDIRRLIKEHREAESKVKSTAQKEKEGYKDMLLLIDNMQKEAESNKE